MLRQALTSLAVAYLLGLTTAAPVVEEAQAERNHKRQNEA